MALLDALPVWGIALIIFCLRLTDVSLGTLRTISIIRGHVPISVLIGFVEVMIWLAAIAQVIARLHETPALMVAYAGGFAAGNAMGILLERRIGAGTCLVRMIAGDGGPGIAAALRSLGYAVTEFRGEDADGEKTLLFTSCRRRELGRVLRAAASGEPSVFYTVDRYSQTGHATPLPHPTGWRAVFKKK